MLLYEPGALDWYLLAFLFVVANLSSLAARVTMSQVKVCAKETPDQLWLVIVLISGSPSKAFFAYPSSSVTAFGIRVGALIRMWRGLEQTTDHAGPSEGNFKCWGLARARGVADNTTPTSRIIPQQKRR